MQENKLFEALLDVIPFAAYAVDINTYEVVYANKLMSENMYAPREEFCWKKIFGQDEVCSWCKVEELKTRHAVYKSEKLISNFFDEVTDSWLQTYDELVKWPDGRTVKYSIAVDITEQKEIQAAMIKTHTKLAIQSKKLKEANEKLEYMAKKDFLTGTNNRGNFFDLSNTLCQKTDDSSIFVAMFDLDKFKLLNDTYGHKAGDLALQSFVNNVQKYLDETDIFGRIGGEEFALVLVSHSSESVIEKIENIRKDIEKILVIHEKDEIHFTVSVGLIQKKLDETIDMALERADKELYSAKDSGRNKLKFRL
jgi:diguanylate cyclase (GGDEF)-like protein